MTLLDDLREDPYALNRAVDFDVPFRVTFAGVERDPEVLYVPSAEHDDEADMLLDGIPHGSSLTDWVALDGYTGQYAYHGPVMHPSEFLGGRLAEGVLESIGDTFVLVEVSGPDDDSPVGWAILRLREPTRKPLDVWMCFEHPDDEEAAYEANTFRTADGGYRIEWYHNAVGLVTSEDFDTLDEAYAWYERNGYQDFSS